jgi:hypothetical protein
LHKSSLEPALAKESIGTKDPARLRSLVVEQQQLIEELALIG